MGHSPVRPPLRPVYHTGVCAVCVCVQVSEQPAADVGLCDGGGHAGPEEPETRRRGARSQLVRALSQLPAGEAAGALPHTHLQTHTREIHTGTMDPYFTLIYGQNIHSYFICFSDVLLYLLQVYNDFLTV